MIKSVGLTQKIFFTMRKVKQWNRLLRAVVQSLFLEVSNTRLVLSHWSDLTASPALSKRLDYTT